MGQLFSTGNRSRANSVISNPYTPSPQMRTQPTSQLQSDTTIIIPLHVKSLDTALEKQHSQESNQEPLISNLGRIYKDELPAFDVSDSNEDIENIPSLPDTLDEVRESSEVPVTMDQLGSQQQIPCDQMENNITFPDGLMVSGVKINLSNAKMGNISNIDQAKSKMDIQVKDLITDVPDSKLPHIGNRSVLDVVKDLAPEVLSKKSIVAIVNSVHVMLSKNGTIGMDIETPEPSEDDVSGVKEWVEEMIVDTIKSPNQDPDNQA